MKKIWLFVFLGAAFFCGGIFWVMRSPQAVMWVAPWIIKRVVPGVSVGRLKAEGQDCRLSGVCAWNDVVFSGQIRGKAFSVSFRRLEWSGWGMLSVDRSIGNIVLEGADLHYPPGQVKIARADISIFRREGAFFYHGPLLIDSMVWDKLKLQSVTAQLAGDGKGVSFREVRAEVFGGTVAGTVIVGFAGPKYNADLVLDRLDTRQMDEFDEALADQIAGKVSGLVSVTGTGERMDGLALDLKMSSGGAVNAVLLGSLIAYLPQSRERERLEGLVKTGGKLAVEVFSVTIRSVSPENLSGEAHLTSKEVNASINVGYDIHTDETWDSLAEYWRSFFKQS